MTPYKKLLLFFTLIILSSKFTFCQTTYGISIIKDSLAINGIVIKLNNDTIPVLYRPNVEDVNLTYLRKLVADRTIISLRNSCSAYQTLIKSKDKRNKELTGIIEWKDSLIDTQNKMMDIDGKRIDSANGKNNLLKWERNVAIVLVAVLAGKILIH